MISLLFKTLGFTENETSTYLALVEVGTSSANALARNVGIPRTTAYSVLASLSEKGLVSSTQENSKTLYVANKPEAIRGFLTQEKQELEAKENAASKIFDYITPYFESGQTQIPKLQMFDGESNLERLLYDFLASWEESIKENGNVFWGYQDASFVENYMPWLRHHWQRLSELHPSMQICLYSNKVAVEEELAGAIPNREIRNFPLSGDFKSTIWVMGDYVVMIFTNARPHYAFQIHNAALGSNLRSIFRVLWSVQLPETTS